MTFERYFKTSSYCLIGAGFVAVISTGSIGLIPICLFAAVYVTSLFVDTVRLHRRIPEWLLNCATVIYVFFFLLDYRILSRSFLAATIHLLFFLAAIKLLTLAKDSDYFHLYLISFAEMLAASTLTVNIVFAFCLLLFLFCGISSLILFEMRRSNARMQEHAVAKPFVRHRKREGSALELFAPFPARLFTGTTIGITLLIIAVAVPLFFLFPRINRGFYQRPSGNTQYVSGFTDHVELGQIGSIKQSDAVVMRIKAAAPEEIPPDLKWRGIALNYFDGRSWTRTDRNRFTVPTQGSYYKLENSAQGTRWLNQTFFVEALPTNVVFAAHKALAISRDVGALQKDFAEALYTDPHPFNKLRYSAISEPIRPDPSKISDLLPIPQEILRAYMQLPRLDPRVAELSKKVAKTAPNRYAKARALERYLRSNYGYSLVLRGTPNSRDPLAMFLFDVRRGHCEYFASAMAIMLRQIGIPSRLVNGFRTGEYNYIGDNWIVRQYDAHSWIEAYFPPYGWVEFDPTPAEPPRARTEFTRLISNLSDAVDLWWWEGVVNYDASKQFRVFSALYSSLGTFRRETGRLLESAYEHGRMSVFWIRSQNLGSRIVKSWPVWMLCILLLMVFMIRPWRRHFSGWVRRILHSGNHRTAITGFYREALAMLEDRGFKPEKGQTPLEFAQTLARQPYQPSFLTLTEIYNSIRFGPPGRSYNRAEAQMQLRLLRDSLRLKGLANRD
ncbi:MAG: DUF3488 domain-containing protein [Acidobacteria bacterium]|nr:DUF3488 domain-containing protein [Acidobacteriota bacterium]